QRRRRPGVDADRPRRVGHGGGRTVRACLLLTRQGPSGRVPVPGQANESATKEVPMTQISLMLAVDDAPQPADWDGRALGATQLWSLGSVIGLELEGAPFFLHEPTGTGFASPAAIGETTVRVEVFVDDPDTLFQRAIAAGADASTDGIRNREAPW